MSNYPLGVKAPYTTTEELYCPSCDHHRSVEGIVDLGEIHIPDDSCPDCEGKMR